jgi:hypothetical protein
MTIDRTVRLTPRQLAHKRAARLLIEAVGGVEAASSYCRLGKSQLSDCCNRNVVAFMPTDVVEDLEAVAPEPAYSRFLARRQAHELVRLPDPSLPESQWSRLIGELAKEAGELTSGICADLATQNEVSREEAERRIPDGEDLVRVAVEFLCALRARAAEGPDTG